MKYRINKSNYHEFNTYKINKLPSRSYFIPYPEKQLADSVSAGNKRYRSSKVMCLNGKWDFRFYPLPADLPDMLDTSEVEWDRIDVPSCWQFEGYDKPFYVNTRYQFPFAPPKIPQEKKVPRTFCWVGADCGMGPVWRSPGKEYNFVGVYRTFFTADDTSKRRIISLLGVASCADVYVNGSFIGYTEGSHNTAEFDISPDIIEGENELLIVVHRWCTGSYLECQDMFRNNGIFRDVLIRIEEKNDIRDIDFAAVKTAGCYSAVVKALTYGKNEVTFTLCGHGLNESRTAVTVNGKAEACFNNLDVAEWTAEDPVLYDLYYETADTCIKERVGFREITVDGDRFLINGKLVKLHGVNHHDTSCVRGYTLTPEELERDMKLCKEYNIDTVRTSHYPPDPYLLELCDELGIYVVDEADLETHGTYSMQIPPTYNTLSHDPKWEPRYLDRAEHLYQRDKMHPSIIMWSLGNESGGYRNTDRMYEYIKSHSSIPVHYESAVHCRKKAYDIASEMYPPADRVHRIGEKKYRIKKMCDRPYFMCEYAHAMGVGPGGMEEYWKEIYSHDSLTGGCVWEMVDHAVLHEDGSYTYGGDHGEWEHDGNFCVDGMFYPDRSPSTGAFITRFIYRPLRVRHIKGNTFEVFNTRSFTNADAFILVMKWNDGTEVQLESHAKPLDTELIELDAETKIKEAADAGSDCLLDVITVEKKSGREVSREQLILHEHIEAAPHDTGNRPLSEIVTEQDGLDFTIGGITIRPSDPYTILFRAPTDNDHVFFGLKNIMKDYIGQKEEVLSIEKEESRAIVTTRIKCRGKLFTCTDTYEACNEGILVTSKLSCDKGKGNIPRFGKAFRMDAEFSHVSYYGRSSESYADMKDQAMIEQVSCSVSEMTEPNIRPQESGNRMDCRWVCIGDGEKAVRFTAIENPFELGIKPYSDRELLSMKHREDEVMTGTYITISAFQQGIGTGICGPATAKEYCYSADCDYELKFLISAY